MKTGPRITGGTARGSVLLGVHGRDVRPALARMRVSVFEILRSRLAEARIADLFAGTGSLGLEALSRGAASCVFFDTDTRSVEVLRKNLAKLRMVERGHVMQASAFDAPRLLETPVDIVFVDPPYAFYDDPATLARIEAAVSALPGRPLAVVEHRAVHDLGEAWADRARTDRRAYGGTHVSFYEVPGP